MPTGDTGTRNLALEALRRVQHSAGFAELSATERQRLAADLARVEGALAPPARDPYDVALDTPRDLQRRLAQGGRPPQGAKAPTPAPAPAPRTRRPDATQTLGERLDDTLDAVDFPGFVAGLVTGTFQAIVDATAQQVREYGELVASISQSVDDFSRDNVTPFQVREWLVERHGADLRLQLPAPGASGASKLVPRDGRAGTTPGWMGDYGLKGQPLDAETVDGVLVQRGRKLLGEERLQALSTMVLMGINRVVVKEGHIRARLQFHAAARDRRRAEVQTLSAQNARGVAGRQVSMRAATRTQVSTIKANTQSDTSIKADLMGEVHLVFATETFPLADFADTPAIQLIQRNARWKGDVSTSPPPTTSPPADREGTP